MGRNLVLGAITLLVTIRFVTEVVPLVPRAANFIDIPVFVLLIIAAMIMPLSRPGPAYLRIGPPAAAFMVLAIASAIINAERTAPAPVLVFVYGFLAPLVVYDGRPTGSGRRGVPGPFSRLLVWLGLLQLAVVAAIDLPRFAPSQIIQMSSAGNSEPTHINSCSSCSS